MTGVIRNVVAAAIPSQPKLIRLDANNLASVALDILPNTFEIQHTALHKNSDHQGDR
jgi:hypothetical protein